MKRLSLKKKALMQRTALGIVAILVISLFGFILISIVSSDNDTDCKKIGLKGSLFGCRINKEYASKHVAYVIGNTQNVPALSFNDNNVSQTKILNYATNTIMNNNDARINVYSVSDSLSMLSRGDVCKKEYTESRDNNQEIEESELQNNIKEAWIKQCEIKSTLISGPNSNGADYYKTIEKAVKALESARESDDEEITVIVYGSGLSDSGMINFANRSDNLLDRDPDDIVQRLIEQGKVLEDKKRIKGLKIVWYGIGETVLPQAPLIEKEKDNLKNIYSEVLLKRFGVKPRFEEIEVDTENSVDTGFTVKTTKVSTEDSLFPVEGITYDGFDAIFEFEGGTDTFVNSNKAYDELDKLAGLINDTQYLNYIDILAYAAKPIYKDDAYIIELSQKRADRIKIELINRGVDSTKLVAKGMGHGHEVDENPNGIFNEALAKKNRIVKFKPHYN